MAQSCASTSTRSMCATRRKLFATIRPTTHKGCSTSWTASSLDSPRHDIFVGGWGSRRAWSSTLCILPVCRLLWTALAVCGVALVLYGEWEDVWGRGKRGMGMDVDVLIVCWEKER